MAKPSWTITAESPKGTLYLHHRVNTVNRVGFDRPTTTDATQAKLFPTRRDARASLARLQSAFPFITWGILKLPPTHTKRFMLRKTPLNRQGYDPSGVYWGRGAPLWYYESSCGEDTGHLRAPHRPAAKAVLRAALPFARFFR